LHGFLLLFKNVCGIVAFLYKSKDYNNYKFLVSKITGCPL